MDCLCFAVRYFLLLLRRSRRKLPVRRNIKLSPKTYFTVQANLMSYLRSKSTAASAASTASTPNSGPPEGSTLDGKISFWNNALTKNREARETLIKELEDLEKSSGAPPQSLEENPEEKAGESLEEDQRKLEDEAERLGTMLQIAYMTRAREIRNENALNQGPQ